MVCIMTKSRAPRIRVFANVAYAIQPQLSRFEKAVVV